MKWMFGTICFLLCAHTSFTVLVGGTGSYAAQQKQTEPPVSELIASTQEHPNPHNPFWIAPQRLGFVSGRDIKGKPQGQVFAIDLQTMGVRELLRRYVFDPSFLPKSNRLSFGAPGKDGVLTVFTKSLGDTKETEYDFEAAAVFGPSWSPDGRKVAFSDASYNSDLFMADAESGKTEYLGDLGRTRETAGTDGPDWSPDGTAIVYVGWDKSSQLEGGGYVPKISRLYQFDLRSRTYKRLTAGSFQDTDPAYSPDGKRIAFVSNRSNSFELWIINRDGTGLRKLTNVGTKGFQVGLGKPAWSPDQKMIAFTVVPSKVRSRVGGFPYEGSRIWLLQIK